jgi:hypothetical protein
MGQVTMNPQFQLEAFLVPHDPLKDGHQVQWNCMEDRPLDTDDLLRQIGGGGYGVAIDSAVAIELSEPGTLLRKNEFGSGYSSEPHDVPQLHVITGLVTAAALKENVLLTVHRACAAENGAADIARTTSDASLHTELLETSQKFTPEVTDEYLERVQAITKALRLQGAIAPSEIATGAVENGGQWQQFTLPPVKRLPLAVEMTHQARVIGVGKTPGQTFDTRAAMAEDAPAYFVNCADMQEITGPLSREFALPTSFHEMFVIASAVRHASISFHLPRQQEDVPLEIVSA